MTLSNGAYTFTFYPSRRDSLNTLAEPGYYEDGKFGIRIENIIVVKKVDTPNNFGDQAFYGFDNLTLVGFVPDQVIYLFVRSSENYLFSVQFKRNSSTSIF